MFNLTLKFGPFNSKVFLLSVFWTGLFSTLGLNVCSQSGWPKDWEKKMPKFSKSSQNSCQTKNAKISSFRINFKVQNINIKFLLNTFNTFIGILKSSPNEEFSPNLVTLFSIPDTPWVFPNGLSTRWSRRPSPKSETSSSSPSWKIFWDQCYKTFYILNLLMFLTEVFVLFNLVLCLW